jgi:hypothetical protein
MCGTSLDLTTKGVTIRNGVKARVHIALTKSRFQAWNSTPNIR